MDSIANDSGAAALIVIPARGSSKGVPRKNLRPLSGKPLIYYAITASRASSIDSTVVVSTEDEEIALLAERFGAHVIERPDELAHDDVPLDPVIAYTCKVAERMFDRVFDVVITVQPTSPLVQPDHINDAIQILRRNGADTVVSVTEDRHLRWSVGTNGLVPDYEERVNRQQLPMCYRETGAVIGCTRRQLEDGTRIGERVEALILPEVVSIDIDSRSGFQLCDAVLKQKHIVFNVIGNAGVGLGHVYRSLMLAHDFVNHEITFVCSVEDELAIRRLRASNYKVVVSDKADRWATTLQLSPDLVINDVLDTDAENIEDLKKAGMAVVNFEDLGSGAGKADLVVNALYPALDEPGKVLTGPEFFCLRDEFLFSQPAPFREKVTTALVTFGGVDEANLTLRCLRVFDAFFVSRRIHVEVVTGPGYRYAQELEDAVNEHLQAQISIVRATRRISQHMIRADFAITSGGRTVFELASLHVPTVVICQNERETTHTFPTHNVGVIRLGLHSAVSDEHLLDSVKQLVDDPHKRLEMHNALLEVDLKRGRARVIERISELFR